MPNDSGSGIPSRFQCCLLAQSRLCPGSSAASMLFMLKIGTYLPVLSLERLGAGLRTAPRSEDKRTAIINAALVEFAARGVWSTRPLGCAKSGENESAGELRLSDQITEESRAAGSPPFSALIELMQNSINDELIRDYPVNFIDAMFSVLAETTMAYIESSKKRRHRLLCRRL
ncbi:hypothetical protein [Duganella sp. LjRoot269]|uniref:hypothetical protein n=1 Tax=Duganella sp. LjRoot269 TaxID=3342305 RepID=UPI003ECEB255